MTWSPDDGPAVDLMFALRGDRAPSLHGMPLYAAISNAVPALHEAEWLGIHQLRGRRLKGTREMVLSRDGRLGLRLPVARMAEVLPLSGKALQLGEHTLQVGVPEVRMLTPWASLVSRHVIVKGFMEPDPFLGALRRQLDALEVVGTIELGPRRVQVIHEKRVVGFGVRVRDLSEDASVRLQSAGLGGRRRMGCGLFVPLRADPA